MGDTFDRWLSKLIETALKRTPGHIALAIISGRFGDRLILLANSGGIETHGVMVNRLALPA